MWKGELVKADSPFPIYWTLHERLSIWSSFALTQLTFNYEYKGKWNS
jgi:hypothetical protein